MRRLALLIAVGALWLFLAALPALADGGPHVAADNSGVSTLTADGCAGCHRAHTAQAAFLLVDEEPDLCLTCHGSAGVGATTDVESGIQYRTALPLGSPGQGAADAVILGALRNGGFVSALIDTDNPARLAYLRNATDKSFRTKVPVSLDGFEPVTSVHMDINAPGPATAWGGGALDSGVGNTVTMECTSCHNPHGNGQYRILRPVPHGSYTETLIEAEPPVTPVTLTITGVNAQNDSVVTSTNHGLPIGTTVTITGGTSGTPSEKTVIAVADGSDDWIETATPHGVGVGATVTVSGLSDYGVADGSYTVRTRTSDVRIVLNVLNTTTRVDITADATGLSASLTASANSAVAGTWKVSGHPALNQLSLAGLNVNSTETATGSLTPVYGATVADAPLPAPGDTRNYTVIETKGTQGDANSGFLLYASQVISGGYGPYSGDYFRRAVPWNPSVTNPACSPTVSNTANTTACSTMQDAPNGQPASGLFDGDLESAFNDEMTAWCIQCHSRYYGGRVFNPEATDPAEGGSNWEFPSGDDIYNYRHTTASNRVCTTCHVGHGSNAVMDGPFSSEVLFPGQADGATPYSTTGSADSRLLKIDNRGTCQACHDPTETVAAGTYLYYLGGVITSDTSAPYPDMKPVP